MGRRVGALAALALVLGGCAGGAPQGSDGRPEASGALPVPARQRIVPLVDAHQHLMSPTAMAILTPPPPLPPVALPAELDRLLKDRAQVPETVPQDAVFTGDAVMRDVEEGRWWTGAARLREAIRNLPPGLEFVPKRYTLDGATATVLGNLRSAGGGEETHNFQLVLRRERGKGWRIASEMVAPINPPVYAPAVTAERVVEVLDDAGIRYAALLSVGYWFGQPAREIGDRHRKTREEND